MKDLDDRFKFRIWLVEAERYYDPLKNREDQDVWFNLLSNGEVAWGYVDVGVEDPDDAPEIVVEQCTGLKDKNGKLIYEGDILRVGRGPIGTKLRFTIDVVEWSGPAGEWEFREVPNKSREWSFLEERLESIGNIHENPELLTEKEKV